MNEINWNELDPLFKELAFLNLEEYMQEIALIIFGSEYEKEIQNKGMIDWDQNKLICWLDNLCFLSNEDKVKLIQGILKECLDGETFPVAYLESNYFSISSLSYYILRIILKMWKNHSGYILPLCLPSKPLGVLAGYISDLTSLHEDIAQSIDRTNKACEKTGEGYIYGQLIVLGYSEFRISEKKWIPVGLPNKEYLLLRRKLSNGLKPILPNMQHKSKYSMNIYESIPRKGLSTDKEDYPEKNEKLLQTIHYDIDLRKDIYQIGRAALSSNDIIIPGHLNVGKEGTYSGPISRWACRIEIDRYPPYLVRIYAGGFDDQQTMNIKGQTIKESPFSCDGFNTFGLKIFQPEVKEWIEISSLGVSYLPRKVDFLGNSKAHNRGNLGNILTNGTIIDLGGVYLLYRDPIHMNKESMYSNTEILSYFNNLKPQCPVLLNEVTFDYQCARVQVKKIQEKLSRMENSSFQSDIYPMHIPIVDYSHLPESQRTYIFTNCGHVHGYHKEMEGRPCSLCRKIGPYVPLVFPFESPLNEGLPTHVFNPCGHVATLECCLYWSSLKFSPYYTTKSYVSLCPFCGSELAKDNPFTKIIIQSDNNFNDEVVVIPPDKVGELSTKAEDKIFIDKIPKKESSPLKEAQIKLFRKIFQPYGARVSRLSFPSYLPDTSK